MFYSYLKCTLSLFSDVKLSAVLLQILQRHNLHERGWKSTAHFQLLHSDIFNPVW